MDEIINKVAQSGLITIDPEEFYPMEQIMELDIAPWLFENMILKEKLFREYIAASDWTIYQGKHVVVHCSADAIIPTWAYMLVSSRLAGIASGVFFGTVAQMTEMLLLQKVESMDASQFEGQRVVLKGCSSRHIPASVYMALTARLAPYVKSVMYGEACSTVPVYKRKD